MGDFLGEVPDLISASLITSTRPQIWFRKMRLDLLVSFRRTCSAPLFLQGSSTRLSFSAEHDEDPVWSSPCDVPMAPHVTPWWPERPFPARAPSFPAWRSSRGLGGGIMAEKTIPECLARCPDEAVAVPCLSWSWRWPVDHMSCRSEFFFSFFSNRKQVAFVKNTMSD